MSKKDITYEATISHVERVGTSTNGNPTYDIFFTDHETARTQTDASIGYEIPNSEWEGARVKVAATAAGRVWGVEHVKPAGGGGGDAKTNHTLNYIMGRTDVRL